MKIKSIKPLYGPNVFNHKSVMIMMLDLENLAEVESKDIPGFVDRLLAKLPGLQKHGCSRRREGGFVERLREGTYFGHIVEHVALELSDDVGVPATYGKTVWGGEDGLYKVVVEWELESVTRHLLETAVGLVEAIVAERDFPLAEAIAHGRRIADRVALGPSTRAIVEAAAKRDIPWRRVDEGSLIQLGHGKRRKYIQATESWNTRSVAVDVACDKNLTKDLLRAACLPVPAGTVVRREEEALAAFLRLRGPVAVKPLDGNHGRGVSLNVADPDHLARAFHIAADESRDVIIEEMFHGRDYRLVVVNGRLVAAAERVPPQVMGDGRRTVAELVDLENASPLRGEGHEKPLTKITIDSIAEACLQRQGLTLSSIPEPGRSVLLRDSANLSVGGCARDVTDDVHPTIKRQCERAAEAIGLDVCGIDLMAGDITKPLERKNGIIEVNAAPGIRMHHHPSVGEPRDVAGAIVDMLYPGRDNGRIPIVSITGTNGKTTTTRLIGHVLAETGLSVGMTTTGGIWVGKEQITEGDTTGPVSARTVLSNPRVDVAVLETARGGIARHGLGYDWSDVGIITNIQEDHIGQDGIESIDDLIWVKSLVAERVREGGTLILNAEDPRLVELTKEKRVQRVPKRIVFFAMNPENKTVLAHVRAGGTAYYIKRGWIVEATGPLEHLIAPLEVLPLTLGGAARYQIENLLAAVAACRAQKIARGDIAPALKRFDSNVHNPGRANLFKVGTGHVFVDYGHNPAAFECVSQVASAWSTRVTGIIGVPGDRCDAVVELAGRTAATGFSRVFIKEDKDLRGRPPGEVATLLCKSAMAAAPDKECRIVLDEVTAFERALNEMVDGETVVVFYEDLEPITSIIERRGGVPIDVKEVRNLRHRPAPVAANEVVSA